MRWACSTRCFHTALQRGEMSLNTLLDSLPLLGLDGVEIAAEHLPSKQSSYAHFLSQRLQEHEMSFAALTCSVLTPERLLEEVEPLLRFAKEGRARLLCLTGVEQWQAYQAPLAELATEAERLSLPIGVAFPSRPGIGAEANALLDEIGSPYLGICFALHAEVTPSSPLWEDWVRMAPFAIHVHLVVSDLLQSLSWLPALEPLREVEYNGFISFLQVPEPAEESLQFLRRHRVLE